MKLHRCPSGPSRTPPGSLHKQPGSGLCRRVIFLGAVVALLLVGGIGGYLAFGCPRWTRST